MSNNNVVFFDRDRLTDKKIQRLNRTIAVAKLEKALKDAQDDADGYQFDLIHSKYHGDTLEQFNALKAKHAIAEDKIKMLSQKIEDLK